MKINADGVKIKIQKISADAVAPTYAHQGDAGLDLCAAEDCVLAPSARAAVRTGLRFEIPDGCAGLIWDKSGLALNKGIKTMGGVVDAGYRGEVKVVLVNFGESPFVIQKGMKIAQMLIQQVAAASIEIIDTADSLSGTERKERGFTSGK